MSFELYSLSFDTSHLASAKPLNETISVLVDLLKKTSVFSGSDEGGDAPPLPLDDFIAIKNAALSSGLLGSALQWEDSGEYLDEAALDDRTKEEREALYGTRVAELFCEEYERIGDAVMKNTDCLFFSATYRYYNHNLSDQKSYARRIVWERRGLEFSKDVFLKQPKDKDKVWEIKLPDKKKSGTPSTVTRADLAEAAYQEVGLSRNKSAKLVEDLLNAIAAALERGEPMKVSCFGNFSVRQKGARVGRNPKTGANVPILPRKVLVFRPSLVLRNKVNRRKGAG